MDKKNYFLFAGLIAALAVAAGSSVVAKTIPLKGANNDNATIQSGTVSGLDNTIATTGFDKWGYNYQAHMFNGFVQNSIPQEDGIPVSSGDTEILKWNDAWLSNTDCNGDGHLDRHCGFATYKGSGAWYTRHVKGTYVSSADGGTCKTESYVKFVALPLDARYNADEGNWYTADSLLIGPGFEFSPIVPIQSVYNDPCGELTMIDVKGDILGLGQW